MLITQSPIKLSTAVGMHKQSGVVLVIALIILVAMTLAGIALVRAVDTANIIAGNLAFQQSATHSGEVGLEAAIRQVEASTANALQVDGVALSGYFARTRNVQDNPGVGISWDAFWVSNLQAQAFVMPEDANGNTVSYVIQRLCEDTGPPFTSRCASVKADTSGNSHDPAQTSITTITQYYYRITARVAGPRNTVSFIQSIVSR
jgi:type IV pilus assembly protein PilX